MKIAILAIVTFLIATHAQSQTKIGDWKFSDGSICSMTYDGWFQTIEAVKIGNSILGIGSNHLAIQRWKHLDLPNLKSYPITVDNGAALATYEMNLSREGYDGDQHLYLGRERNSQLSNIYSFLAHISANSEFRMYIDYKNAEDYDILELSLKGTSEALLAFSNCKPEGW